MFECVTSHTRLAEEIEMIQIELRAYGFLIF
jgi:hypothetical protein